MAINKDGFDGQDALIPADRSVHEPVGVGEQCVLRPLDRLRFWDGRFLVARDLRDQQASQILRTEYHQRFAHGTGVLCGFGVSGHPHPGCHERWVIVEPGMAYDCCGRTLLMTNRQAVELFQAGAQGKDVEGFLVARRKDRPVDPVPSLYAEDLGNPVRTEFGRIREDVELQVVPADKVSDTCWPRPRPVTRDDRETDTTRDCLDDVGANTPCPTGCACRSGVILARLSKTKDTKDIEIDTTHRRVIAPPSALTRIDGINWPHGGEVTLDGLTAAEPEGMGGQLIVRFSRPLGMPKGDARGINRQTFTVSYLTQTGAMEFILPPDPEDLRPGELETPRLSPNRRCAIFDIPDGLLKGRTSIRNSTLFVTIRGDFLEDCWGRAVSCAHIRGDAAYRGTGNGVEGGLFESWFYVS